MLDALSIGKLSPGLLLKLIAAKALPKRSLAQLLYFSPIIFMAQKRNCHESYRKFEQRKIVCCLDYMV